MAKTAPKSTDEAVMELLRTVDKKKKEIQALKKKPIWYTNCTFGYSAESSHDRVNIQTRRDLETLVGFYAFLLERETYLAAAAEELGVKVEFTHLNYPISEWKADLKTRIGQLSIEEKQKEIDELDKRVNKLVSPDQRREMELKALQEILGQQ